eukprot:CAMPEP_0113581190 /NCGR_PEP_ID=MMETSP0015_2-20120614/31132_1 /TAXON_ID=2838 /ORGANISM="Odontella" /LENGTH=397 /DNA_ID=CAMNT_0000485545 /DNA_START=338 /DNA_END=1531 /DNA_ORIENTATION=+ /assembly_acc=CAM_ASM_000160
MRLLQRRSFLLLLGGVGVVALSLASVPFASAQSDNDDKKKERRCKRIQTRGTNHCTSSNSCQKCYRESIANRLTSACFGISEAWNCCKYSTSEDACEDRNHSRNECVWTWNKSFTGGKCTSEKEREKSEPKNPPEVGSRKECRSREMNQCTGKCIKKGDNCRPNRDADADDDDDDDNDSPKEGTTRFCKIEAEKISLSQRPAQCPTLSGCDWDLEERRCRPSDRVDNPLPDTQKYCELFYETAQECEAQASNGCEYDASKNKKERRCSLKRTAEDEDEDGGGFDCDDIKDDTGCRTVDTCDWDLEERRCRLAKRVDNPLPNTRDYCALFYETAQECEAQADNGCEYDASRKKKERRCRLKGNHGGGFDCEKIADDMECQAEDSCEWNAADNGCVEKK